MKFILNLVALAFLVFLVKSAPSNDSEWENYKNKHGKSYSESEYSLRKQIWKDKKAKIDKHNELHNKGRASYRKGTNQFTDMV